MPPVSLDTIEATGLFEKRKNKRDNPNRRVIIERRTANSDRRISSPITNYNGPYRRETVDRRQNNKDRRNE
jgi:hypothetical protein